MEKQRRKTYLDSITSNNDVEESYSLLQTDALQMEYIHPKKREDLSPASTNPKDQTIECEIQPKDTLSSLSLKYNIPLAELKRVNNIMKDSEFFALKRIKIPVKPSSFLSDLIPGVHSQNNQKENGWYFDSKDTQSCSNFSSSVVSSGCTSPYSEADLINQNSKLTSKDQKKAKKFLKEMDKDLERIKERTANILDKEGEGDWEVTEEQEVSSRDRIEVMYSNFEQLDDGLSNGSLICWCFLIVFVVLSVLAILAALLHVDHHSASNDQDGSNKISSPSLTTSS